MIFLSLQQNHTYNECDLLHTSTGHLTYVKKRKVIVLDEFVSPRAIFGG